MGCSVVAPGRATLCTHSAQPCCNTVTARRTQLKGEHCKDGRFAGRKGMHRAFCCGFGHRANDAVASVWVAGGSLSPKATLARRCLQPCRQVSPYPSTDLWFVPPGCCYRSPACPGSSCGARVATRAGREPRLSRASARLTAVRARTGSCGGGIRPCLVLRWGKRLGFLCHGLAAGRAHGRDGARAASRVAR